jgi:hypothetical protein
MQNEKRIQTKAIQLISDYFGTTTGQLYITFYEKQDEQTILTSLKELLTEYLGPQRTEEIFQSQGFKEAIT